MSHCEIEKQLVVVGHPIRAEQEIERGPGYRGRGPGNEPEDPCQHESSRLKGSAFHANLLIRNQLRTSILFTTSFTPSVFSAVFSANFFAPFDPTSPVRVTVPQRVETLMSDALTPRARASAIFTLAVVVASRAAWLKVRSTSSGSLTAPSETWSLLCTLFTPLAFLAISPARAF